MNTVKIDLELYNRLRDTHEALLAGKHIVINTSSYNNCYIYNTTDEIIELVENFKKLSRERVENFKKLSRERELKLKERNKSLQKQLTDSRFKRYNLELMTPWQFFKFKWNKKS